MHKELNSNILENAPTGLLLNFALVILDEINKDKNTHYDETKYGSVKDIKKWEKKRLIKWLANFNLSLYHER